MLPSERFSLPFPSLLVSIILSATCMGLMIPYARVLPLVFGCMTFTLIYHSIFMISAYVDRDESSVYQPRLYILPLNHPHTVWIFMIALFWLASSIHSVAALTSGNTSDADFCLAIFSGLEFLLNAHIAYLCGTELRKKNARWKSDLDVTLESIRNFRQRFFFG